MAQDILYPFGLRKAYTFAEADFSAATPTYATGQAVLCPKSLAPSYDMSTAMLEGEDRICRSMAQIDSITVAINAGGVDLQNYADLIGGTATDSGSTPDASTYMDIKVSNTFNRFGLIANSYGDDSGVFQMIFFNCKLESVPVGSFEKGAYHTPTVTAKCVASTFDGDTIARFSNHEGTTTATISTTWATNALADLG